jgi:hypothetical protein
LTTLLDGVTDPPAGSPPIEAVTVYVLIVKVIVAVWVDVTFGIVHIVPVRVPSETEAV